MESLPTTRYCWRCATALERPPPTVCGACGQEHFANPKPCGEAVVLRDGCVLLIRRARDPWAGCWDTPGGFCDQAEHPMHAAERELLEEVGLAGRAIAYLGTWIDRYGQPAADGAQEYTANSAYVVRLLGDPGALAAQAGEVSAIEWFDLHELPAAQLAFPDHTPIVLAAAARYAQNPGSFPEPADRLWE